MEVIWEQSVTDSATIGKIWANRYTLGDGWGTAEPIETDLSASSPGLPLTLISLAIIPRSLLRTYSNGYPVRLRRGDLLHYVH